MRMAFFILVLGVLLLGALSAASDTRDASDRADTGQGTGNDYRGRVMMGANTSSDFNPSSGRGRGNFNESERGNSSTSNRSNMMKQGLPRTRKEMTEQMPCANQSIVCGVLAHW